MNIEDGISITSIIVYVNYTEVSTKFLLYNNTQTSIKSLLVNIYISFLLTTRSVKAVKPTVVVTPSARWITSINT